MAGVSVLRMISSSFYEQIELGTISFCQKGAIPELTVDTLPAQEDPHFLRLQAMDNMCV